MKGTVSLAGRAGKEGQLVELVGDQNQSPEASPRCSRGPEWRKQKRFQEKSDCQRSDRKRVGVPGLLRRRRFKEMKHSNTFHGGQKYLLSPREGDNN